MEFCPTCGNMLQYAYLKFTCSTCPYMARIDKKVELRKKQLLVKKNIDSVVTDEDMKTGAETEASCSVCYHNKAYFLSVQIRSADEPESRFYKCLRCKHTWREE